MTYQPGDYVYPTDLTRPTLCRVQAVEPLGDHATAHLLKLEPLEGPWPPDTHLLRLDATVIPAHPSKATTPRPDRSV